MSLREQMPLVTAFYDDLRAEFGAECINRQIQRGMRGEAVFCATENGITVGTPMPELVGVTPAPPLVRKESKK